MVDDAFEIQITNRNLGYISQRNKDTLPLIHKTTPFCFCFTLHVCSRDIKHSAFRLKHFLLYFEICLNIHSFAYSEVDKYRLGLRRNEHVLTNAIHAYLLYSDFIYNNVQSKMISKPSSYIKIRYIYFRV